MNIFIKIPGITGDCSDKNHSGWIAADIIQWGSGRKITTVTSTRGDRESSNATISDLIIYKLMDRSTASLFLAACCGTGQDIEIHLTKTGAGQGADVYMIYTLKNAIVSHYTMQAKGKSHHRPYEEVYISFTAMTIRYTPYNEDGNITAPIAVGFDTSMNTKI